MQRIISLPALHSPKALHGPLRGVIGHGSKSDQTRRSCPAQSAGHPRRKKYNTTHVASFLHFTPTSQRRQQRRRQDGWMMKDGWMGWMGWMG